MADDKIPMARLTKFVDDFLSWIENNLILFERELVVEGLDLDLHDREENKFLTKIMNHPKVVALVEEVKTAGFPMENVYAELYYQGSNLDIQRLNIVVLNSAANPKHSRTARARALGFRYQTEVP